jgi:hypothetical protein
VQVDQLRKTIEEAFDSVEVPRFEDLLAPRFRNSIDPLELAAAFREKQWRDLPAREVFRHRESLSTLSPVGYRSYIAPYLLGSLEGEDAADLVEYALFSLRPATDAQADADEVMDRLAAFDTAQREAIRGWLEYQLPHHPLASTILQRWT